MRIKAGTLVDVRTSSVDHDTFSDSDEYVVVNPESPESSRPDDTPDSSVASDSKRSKSSKDGGGPPDGPQLNRGVLITCAGGDVGRAIALHFVRRGFRRLYLIDHEPRRHALYETRRLCRDVACSVWSTHPEPRPVFKRIVEAEVVSLTGWSAVEKVVERAREKLQGIWYCVHWPSLRARSARSDNVFDIPQKDFAGQQAVQSMSAYFIIRSVARAMRKAGHGTSSAKKRSRQRRKMEHHECGRIAVVFPTDALAPGRNKTIDVAAAFATLGLVRNAAFELNQAGIRLGAICPETPTAPRADVDVRNPTQAGVGPSPHSIARRVFGWCALDANPEIGAGTTFQARGCSE